MEILEDKILICLECKEEFVFFKGEQLFYMRRAEELRKRDTRAKFPPPKRCPVCRKRNQQLRNKVRKIQEDERNRFDQLELPTLEFLSFDVIETDDELVLAMANGVANGSGSDED